MTSVSGTSTNRKLSVLQRETPDEHMLARGRLMKVRSTRPHAVHAGGVGRDRVDGGDRQAADAAAQGRQPAR